MDLTLEQYGDRELWYAEAEDKSWQLPLWIDWHLDRKADRHYAHVLPALCLYYNQALLLQALFQSYDILGEPKRWVLPRRMVEVILHKAPGITRERYYRWPDQACPPIAKTIQELRVELTEMEPRSMAHESFVQHLARTRSISSSIINVVLTGIAEEGPAWMLEQRKPLDLGFCRLLAVPFRANWKELVTYKARALGLKLASLMHLPHGEKNRALREAGLPELLSSPQNIGLRRGWKAHGESVRLDYTIEAVAGDKFERVANKVEAKRQSKGATHYVSYYEETVELLYEYLVQAMQAFLRKAGAPFAQVCEGGRDGVLRFLPVHGRKVRVRDKALRDYPVHIVPPDSCFSVFGQESDPRLIQGTPVVLRTVRPFLPAAHDVRESTVEGNFQLEGGEGADGLPLLHAGQGAAPGQPVLAQPEAGAGLDDAGGGI